VTDLGGEGTFDGGDGVDSGAPSQTLEDYEKGNTDLSLSLSRYARKTCRSGEGLTGVEKGLVPRRNELDGGAAADVCVVEAGEEVVGAAAAFFGVVAVPATTRAGTGGCGSSRVPSTFLLLGSAPSPEELATTTASPSFFFFVVVSPKVKSVTPPIPISSKRFLRFRRMLRLE
jgi:hypothetical protein